MTNASDIVSVWPELSTGGTLVVENRLVARNSVGDAVENWGRVARRVAMAIAGAEAPLVSSASDTAPVVTEYAALFEDLLRSLDFLPNSPTLANAGRPLGQLSACFVLPVEDSLEGIFETVKHAALIHQSGGGTGFAFSRLRPEGSIVRSTSGVASGPVSFMKVFDGATEAIKQGGMRRGANMGILRVDHPDIDKFVAMKADMTTLQNFNISVAITEKFMQALDRDADYDLIDPHNGAVVGTKNARELWNRLIQNAWKNGDPGLIFIDRINASASNPVPSLGPIEASNPCGEQLLYPYDSCNLGSLNLAHFVEPGEGSPRRRVLWGRLRERVRLAVRFLDNVVELSEYPLPQIAERTRSLRRIGLGVMGWAEMLMLAGVPYDTPAALDLAQQVAGVIADEAEVATKRLAGERGPFPLFTESMYADGAPRRNAALTTVAPTGTLSIIAGVSGGIEPAYALVTRHRHRLDRASPDDWTEFVEVNATLQATGVREGWWTPRVEQRLTEGATAREAGIPNPERFLTAHEVPPAAHVAMQAVWQAQFHDGGVSKTINLPHAAGPEVVDAVYRQAYRNGCKGITVYRDGSRAHQVLSHPAGPAGGVIAVTAPAGESAPRARCALPATRGGITHQFRVGERTGFIHVNRHPDGWPCEVFLDVAKQGTEIAALCEGLGRVVSLALQHGVPLEPLAHTLRGIRAEGGLTDNPAYRSATSVLDYLGWFLGPPAGGGVAPSADPVKGSPVGEQCPECSGPLRHEAGCVVCGCGYSKC